MSIKEQEKVKTTYRYDKDQCKELDILLKDIADSKDLFEIDINENRATVNNILILIQQGLIEDVSSPIPNSPSNIKYYKICSSQSLGAEFYRNGGFTGERERNIQVYKDKKFTQKMAIIAVISSLIGGGAMGAIVNWLLK
jgi:hypothetical protein